MARAPFAHLESLLSDLVVPLEKRYEGTDCRFVESVVAYEADWTRGWRATIAKLGPRRPHLEVWYDYFLPFHKPTLWIGLSSPSWPELVRHYADISIDLNERRLIGDDQIVWKKGHLVVRTDVPRAKLESICAETHGSPYYAGRFFIGDLANQSQRTRILRAARTFIGVLFANASRRNDDSGAGPSRTAGPLEWGISYLYRGKPRKTFNSFSIPRNLLSNTSVRDGMHVPLRIGGPDFDWEGLSLVTSGEEVTLPATEARRLRQAAKDNRRAVYRLSLSPREADRASLEEIQRELDKAVRKSQRDKPAARRKRLLAAGKRKPTRTLVSVAVFARNPDVIAEVLEKAKGICGGCGKDAPFQRRNGQPYLEVHHKKMLSDGGMDTVKNAVALCPNCHRFRHHGLAALRA